MLSCEYRLKVYGLLPSHKKKPFWVLSVTDPVSWYARINHGATVNIPSVAQTIATRSRRHHDTASNPPASASHSGASSANGARLARVSTEAPSARPAPVAVRTDPLRRTRSSRSTASAIKKVYKLVS